MVAAWDLVAVITPQMLLYQPFQMSVWDVHAGRVEIIMVLSSFY
jgi:hypothetical protein